MSLRSCVNLLARSPFILLLAVNLTVGFLTFQDYGLSWDEPLFYDYADSIWKAYTPQAFTPDFNFDTVYGHSPDDHKIYGPAYILLARPLQKGLQASLRLDLASAWHLVNFLTFQIGLIGLYRLARRWLEAWPATLSAAFFAWQPVFWGHAFINPKDAPFMVFFLWALTLGLEMVDKLTNPAAQTKERLLATLSAALLLGLTSAIRVIGPLAGALVGLYFLLNIGRRKGLRAAPWLGFLAYGLLALLTMFVFWPYLWADPVNRLAAVLKHMSDNPTELAVLFMGQIFRANAMPRRYLPAMLGLTLTEPTWVLFFIGLILAARQFFKKTFDFHAPLVVLVWFVFMIAYLLYFTPAMYDGFRHFLFILPPVFIFCGFAFQWLLEAYWYPAPRLAPTLIAALLLYSGVSGIWQMHPYEYAYYNQVAGGVRGAYRVYETDYWLTCYKEALEWVKYNETATTLHVQRELAIAAYYAEGLKLKDLGRESETDIQSGDLMLFHTRANLDVRSIYRNLPVVTSFGRDGAEFCLIKRKD